MIRSGKLRFRVDVQKPLETRDDHGEPIESWQTVATRFVRLQGISNERSGVEFFNAGVQETAYNRFKATLRWEQSIKAITPKWRLREATCQDRIFEIESVLNVEERNREYLLRVREVFV